MSSDNPGERKTLLDTISGEPIYILIVTQLLATVIAIGIGYCVVCRQMGISFYPQAYAPFALATIICGGTIGVSIALGYLAFIKVANKITTPLTTMASTASRLSRTRSTTRFVAESDISEVVQIAEAFNALYNAQEKQIDELIEMIKSLMHDIRTPLSHITGQAELIESGYADLAEATSRIKCNCRLISRLFDDHTEITLNNKHSDRSPRESVNFSEIVINGCDLYDGLAEAKEQTLKCSVPNRPVVFLGHKNKLQRLLSNLLDNAIKYTPQGGHIHVTLTTEGRLITLKVSDDGIGIAPSDQPHVFDHNFRGSNAKHVSGLGLGLTMIKSITSFYGGDISLHSCPTKGTTFTIRLPGQ